MGLRSPNNYADRRLQAPLAGIAFLVLHELAHFAQGHAILRQGLDARGIRGGDIMRSEHEVGWELDADYRAGEYLALHVAAAYGLDPPRVQEPSVWSQMLLGVMVLLHMLEPERELFGELEVDTKGYSPYTTDMARFALAVDGATRGIRGRWGDAGAEIFERELHCAQEVGVWGLVAWFSGALDPKPPRGEELGERLTWAAGLLSRWLPSGNEGGRLVVQASRDRYWLYRAQVLDATLPESVENLMLRAERLVEFRKRCGQPLSDDEARQSLAAIRRNLEAKRG